MKTRWGFEIGSPAYLEELAARFRGGGILMAELGEILAEMAEHLEARLAAMEAHQRNGR